MWTSFFGGAVILSTTAEMALYSCKVVGGDV